MSDAGILKVTIYVARHGECVGNKDQAVLDPITDFLTDTGKEQAELLGRYLKDVHFTKVYASDYPRTHETAKLIMTQNSSSSTAEVKTEARLRERGYTGLIGLEAAKVISNMMAIMRQGTPYLQVEMPDCETIQQFEDRIISFVSEVLRGARTSSKNEETLLFVSHALTIQRLMVLLNSRYNDFGIKKWTKNLFSEKMMKNTGYHKLIFEIPKDGSLDVVGYVDHAHCREHINHCTSGNGGGGGGDLKDTSNYTFLETNEFRTHEDETKHYCKPV